jgi:hypothetical protein
MESSTEYLSLALPMPATAGAYGRSTDEGLQMIGIRRLIIKTAEILMIVLVVLTILGFAIFGAIAGGQTNTIVAVIGLIVGGFVGLVIAAVTASFFFLILEIAENTRRPA